MTRSRAPYALHLFALAAGFALLFASLGSFPGLEADEAWVGLRAWEISRGATPLVGMTPYTGPLHQYLVEPALLALGWNAWALRFAGAALTVLSAHLLFVVVRRVRDEWTAAFTTAVLVSLPVFSLLGRQAIEVCALGPVLATGAAALLVPAPGGDSAKFRAGHGSAALLGGLLLALGLWNHVLFAPVVIVFGAAALARRGRAIVHDDGARKAAVGFALGLLPRALAQFSGTLPPLWSLSGEPGGAMRLLGRILDWPPLFLRFLHGDVLFLHYTGEVAVPSLPLVPVLFCASIAWSAWAAWKREDGARFELSVAAGVAAIFLLTLFISPANAERYQLLVLWGAAPLLAFGLRRALAPGRGQTLRIGIAAALFAVELVRCAANGPLAFSKSGGRFATFDLGLMEENSVVWVANEPLYERLVARGVRRVWTEFFVGMPLRFFDLPAHRLDVRLLEDPHGPITLGPNDRVVTFRSGGAFHPALHPELSEVDGDEHFVILAPVTKPPE